MNAVLSAELEPVALLKVLPPIKGVVLAWSKKGDALLNTLLTMLALGLFCTGIYGRNLYVPTVPTVPTKVTFLTVAEGEFCRLKGTLAPYESLPAAMAWPWPSSVAF